ncbi:MAG: hypothetical protein P8X57_14585 [Cyclobacteriaceae bacterium]
MSFPLFAQEGNMRTVNYYQGLEMDIYPVDSDIPAPAVLFVHGGGFSGGSRDSDEIRNRSCKC